MNDDIKIIPPGWYPCKEGKHLWPTKEEAEESPCCKTRHSKEHKEVYQPKSKSPGAWV